MCDKAQVERNEVPSIAEQMFRKQAEERVYQKQNAMAGRPLNVDEIINEIFTYHTPNPEQVLKLQNIREAAKYFAKVIVANSPSSADQSVAIRKLRECVMTANAAIVLDGRSFF